ncbi:Uncharacterized protein SCG7109_AE_00240 [Chlamydiales bacterium SCGC AG-110-M15]|nr:Uncharacterized protein SCG7109_AE_00240 [Chlamydiales bacterium SCGC AG-110-M15]
MQVITSTQNPYIKHLVKLRSNSSYRRSQRSLVLPGKIVLSELPSNYPIKKLMLLDGYDFNEICNAEEIIYASAPVLKKASGLENPDPVLIELDLPPEGLPETINRLLICDAVSDPGNMGTLIRTALAFDWDAIYFLNSCVDPFNDKAIRASKGALFHLPFAQGNWDDLSQIIQQHKLHPWVADLKGESPDTIPQSNPIALVVCSESQGPSNETVNHCKPLSIPMPGKMESLNVAVAGGILMHTLSKQPQVIPND